MSIPGSSEVSKGAGIGKNLGVSPRIEAVSEDCLMVRYGDTISSDIPQQIQALVQALQIECGAAIVDFVPSYTSLLLQFDLLQISPSQLRSQIEAALAGHAAQSAAAPAKLIQIPVCYDPQFALDAQAMQAHCGLPFEEIVARHCATVYTVYAIGFCPGFAFLGDVPLTIAAPRKASPRAKVPAGSVGIAGRQTAVYPMASPGGWNIIGRSPMRLIDFSLPTLSPFEIAAQVRFSSISLAEYEYLSQSVT